MVGFGTVETLARLAGETPVFTVECSHAFHFPCIAAHVRSHASLACLAYPSASPPGVMRPSSPRFVVEKTMHPLSSKG
ncbi:unnamed protein product [Musa textilis]